MYPCRWADPNAKGQILFLLIFTFALGLSGRTQNKYLFIWKSRNHKEMGIWTIWLCGNKLYNYKFSCKDCSLYALREMYNKAVFTVFCFCTRNKRFFCFQFVFHLSLAVRVLFVKYSSPNFFLCYQSLYNKKMYSKTVKYGEYSL